MDTRRQELQMELRRRKDLQDELQKRKVSSAMQTTQGQTDQSPESFSKQFSDALQSSASSPGIQSILGAGDALRDLLSFGMLSRAKSSAFGTRPGAESGEGLSYNIGKIAGTIAPAVVAEPIVASSKLLSSPKLAQALTMGSKTTLSPIAKKILASFLTTGAQ